MHSSRSKKHQHFKVIFKLVDFTSGAHPEFFQEGLILKISIRFYLFTDDFFNVMPMIFIIYQDIDNTSLKFLKSRLLQS